MKNTVGILGIFEYSYFFQTRNTPKQDQLRQDIGVINEKIASLVAVKLSGLINDGQKHELKKLQEDKVSLRKFVPKFTLRMTQKWLDIFCISLLLFLENCRESPETISEAYGANA